MLAEMSSPELNDWIAFYALESDARKLIAQGMDETLAYEGVWKTPED
jgi:hypothetical protein